MIVLSCAGCATGVPLGGRTKLTSSAQRPFGPAAKSRSIPRDHPASASALSFKGGRTEVVETAKALVGKSQVKVDGRVYPDDCTGLVSAVYGKLGVSLLDEALPTDNAVTAMYRFAKAHGRVFESGRPLPGDLVFFKETYDQNRDGRDNDGLTHIGIVEEAYGDGTILVIHRVKRGVVRYRMNLEKPAQRKDPGTGRVLNDALRRPGPIRREVLTGQLFAAFGSLLPATAMTATR